MGSVRMGTAGSIRMEGSLIEVEAYCLYCDECGSFGIGKRITLKLVIGVAFVAAIATAFCIYSGANGLAVPFLWFLCFAPLVYFGLGPAGVLELGLRCRKCGNRNIGTSTSNVLNYAENDRSILDVPYEATTKIYRDSY